ncbi:MAG: LysM peptidoglycan-binding domain-containing protein [Spirochaetales bacterium]|nr:LysM peptidoglycan-binding domain-containing protein [Spirochaetales bacterium]
MRKPAIAVAVLLLAAAALFAQDFSDNEYLVKAREYESLARQSFDEGDYDAAADYAAQSKEFSRLSDEYVARMLARSEASTRMGALETRIAEVEGFANAEDLFANLDAARASLDSAAASFEAEDYVDAADFAESGLIALEGLTESGVMPASYVVRLLLPTRECLWRIAAYPWVYNDKSKWPLLWEANRDTFEQPDNPHLIEPGQVLVIPSLAGELRSGAWDPEGEYPAFGE